MDREPAAPQSQGLTDQERNLAAFRRLIDQGFSEGVTAVVDEVCAGDVIEHQDGFTDPESVKRGIDFLHALAPDLRVTIEDVVAAGDRVWARLRAHGTHTGTVLGGPSGRTFDVTVIDICRFQGGRIAEHWGVPDRLAQMQQLGLLPAAAAGAR